MEIFYFTYGSEGQPFSGGWTEIEAPDARSACALFRAFHPDKTEGLLNCSSVYNEERFSETGMRKEGNLGARCRERITVSAWSQSSPLARTNSTKPMSPLRE